MKRFFSLIVILAISFIVSCQKESSKATTENDCFEYNGVNYNTLQEAVSAAEKAYVKPETDLTIQDLLDYPAIKANKDVRGYGARISDDFEGAIVIDFQDYQYTLIDNGSIHMPNGKLLLRGDGGCLISEDDTPSIVCENGLVALGRTLKVSSSIVFQGTQSVFALLENFEGSLEGDMILESSVFAVYSADADIHIPTLEMPSNSNVSVFTQMTSPVVIDKCELNVSSGITTICADYEGSIKVADGTEVHVHNWEIETQPATCTVGPKTKKKCKVCGQEVNDIKANFQHMHDYAPCEATDLVHHPAKEATNTEFGNIEYWECSKCGKLYSDADGKSLITSSVTIKPDPYNYNQNIFNYGDMFQDLFGLETKGKVKAITKGIKAISKLTGMGDGIAGLFSGDDYSEEFDAINERLDVLDNKMDALGQKTDEMSHELENISNQLAMTNKKLDTLQQSIDEISETVNDINYKTNQILVQMSNLTGDIEATELLTQRHNNIVSLKLPTESAYNSLYNHSKDFIEEIAAAKSYNDSIYACKLFIQQIKNLVVTIWDGKWNGAKNTSDLMAQFSNMSYGKNSTFPNVLKAYANSHVDWENQAYSYRIGTLEEERYILGMAFGLLQIYYCFIGDHYFMEEMLNAQNEMEVNIAELTRNDIEDMQNCYNDYRLYNPAKLKFKATMSKINYGDLDGLLSLFSEDSTGDIIISSIDAENEEDFLRKYGIYKDKCMTKNDFELVKNSWLNSGLSESISFVSFLCATGVGGVEFLGGSSLVFPFVDEEPFRKSYIDDAKYPQYVRNYYYAETHHYTCYINKKVWIDSQTPYYSSCCFLEHETTKVQSLSTGQIEYFYGNYFYSIEDEQPDNYAFNCYTPQFY